MKAKPKEPARILIADDHPIIRSGLARLIGTQRDLRCCGETANGAETLRLAETLRPDLLILDLRLKNGDGLELIKNLRARVTCLKILVLSEYEHPLFAERALRAGALGYIAKDSSAEGVIAAIRSVLAGDLHLTESMATRLLRGVVSTDAETSGVSSLSDRQLHVLYLLGAGLSTREIAGASSLSFKTVETHRENLKRKLGLRTASELLRFAYSVAETKLSPEPAGEI